MSEAAKKKNRAPFIRAPKGFAGTKPCGTCGLQFGLKKPDGRKRAYSFWLQQQYCSWECQCIGRTRKRMDQFEEKFWSRVDRKGPRACWIWTAGKSKEGYGVIYQDGQNRRAHRISYQLISGECPAHLILRHTCNNKSCVNPHHLVTGMHFDNVRDYVEAGGRTRWPKGYAAKPHKQREYFDAYRRKKSALAKVQSSKAKAMAHLGIFTEKYQRSHRLDLGKFPVALTDEQRAKLMRAWPSAKRFPRQT